MVMEKLVYVGLYVPHPVRSCSLLSLQKLEEDVFVTWT